MFTSKVAKPQTKEAADSTKHFPHQHSTVLALRAGVQTRDEPGDDHEQKADPESVTAREASRGVAWSFSKTPIFPLDRTHLSHDRSAFTAPRLLGAVQRKLSIGQINDALEHEADRIADEVMRMPDPELSISAAQPQINRNCSACEGEDKDREKLQRSRPPRYSGKPAWRLTSCMRRSGRPASRSTRILAPFSSST